MTFPRQTFLGKSEKSAREKRGFDERHHSRGCRFSNRMPEPAALLAPYRNGAAALRPL
jgi:hypothetical protein